MDAAPEFDNKSDRFKYWFTNVFWYHYKWHTIALIAVIVIAVSTVVSAVTKNDPDVVVIIATESIVDSDYSSTLKTELEELVKQITEKDEVYVELSLVDLNGSSQIGQANQMLFSIEFVRDDSLLFILEDSVIELALESGNLFQNLEPYGFGDETLLDVTDSTKLQELCYHNQDVKLYAGLVDKEVKNENMTELSVAVLEYLLWNKS